MSDFWLAGLFFLGYISLLCIWWRNAVQNGEFDITLLEQIGLKGVFDEIQNGR